MSEEKKPFERLPTKVVPRNYKLELTPDLKVFTFKGKLEITVEVREATSEFVVNAADLEIHSISCGGQEAKFSLDAEAETLTITASRELPVGDCAVAIDYTGKLNDQMRGFYRSKYTHPDHPGEDRYAAVTQFEAVDARRALPCWDEPVHKASYDVTLVVPKDRVALSNMNVVSEDEVAGDLKKVTFARTPIMSSYLLAFIVGEFDFVEARDSNNVLVRVYTPVGKADQGQFALDVSVKTLPYYHKYFDIPYPLPKMDLIAIQDFAAGAMENWGLVTYRERLLLVDPDNSTAITKQLVALVVGHELAHQWFGNLVTMEWWTHLWLNEGFATWIEYLCVDHTHPEFDIWTNFLSREYAGALGLDSLSNSHPIEVPVGPPSEVEEIFDAISYSKGSCVIRMLHDWIGVENFRSGLGSYLKKFAYKNAVTEDLWASLEAASGKPVLDVMSTWTKQMGFPVISVQGKKDGNKMVLTLSQKKFCANGDIGDFGNMRWKVPITIATKNNPEAVKIVLEEESTTVTVDGGVDPGDYILVNPGRQGFYRVNYTFDLFSLLLPALKDGSLSAQDRLGLQSDAFALAKAGVGNTVDVLRLLSAYGQEPSYTVWESLSSNLGTLGRLFSYTDFYDSYKKYVVGICRPSFDRLGWDTSDTDKPLDVMLRSLVISMMGKNGDEGVKAEAKKRFDSHVTSGEAIDSNLKSAIFTLAMAGGDESTFEQLMELHDKYDSNEEKVRIYRCLGMGDTDQLTMKCLDLVLSDEVRSQDSWVLFSSASSCSPRSRDLSWKFLQNNWTTIKDRFQAAFLLARIIDIATGGFVSEDRADEVEKFFEKNPWPVANRVVKQNCEAIRLNAKWLERDREAVKEWLTSQ